MSDEVRVERREGWRKLVLNRPDKLNAANEAMLTALIAALDEAEADRACRALLLTGEGRGFCAGQELGRGRDAGAGRAARSRRGRRTCITALVRRLRGLPLPVVCAVNGVAAGAGASYRAGLRHRAGGAQREVHPGVRARSAWCRIPAPASSCRA